MLQRLLQLCFLCVPLVANAEAAHPNVIVVFIDDMGWGDFSCFGNRDAQTPNIDRLAAEGIRFSQFYVNSPICSPSRCALTTGQYPQRWRITSFLNNRAACSHEWWHEFDEKKKNEQLRAHAHMKMREVAYFLQRLANPECVEPNGKTILENSLITISTESGDGRHDDVKRELSGIFHAITGANGRFKTGEILDVGAEGIDVYNTLLEGMNVSRRLGPSKREGRRIDSIRA